MSTTKPLFYRILKSLLWIVGILVFLFTIVALLIQIPSVQNKIVSYATSFVSNKTNTRVAIGNIGISFPKSIVIEDLFLEDTKKDTLLFAGRTRINIALFNLLRNKISVSSFALENATLKLNNTLTDSLFNYNFLITAFSDTTSKVKADTASKWSISIDKISLEKIRLNYNDLYGGITAGIKLRNLEVQMNEFDLQNSKYDIDKMLVDGLDARVLMNKTKPSTSNASESSGTLPIISANKIQINNSTATYGDSVSKQSVLAVIDVFEINNGSIDLQKELVSAGNIRLSKSQLGYETTGSTEAPDTTIVKPVAESKNNWQVTVKSIDLIDNALAYRNGINSNRKRGFDPEQLDFKHLTLEANDFFYSPENTKIVVKNFVATDQNNFAITKFETDFNMDPHSISLKNLKAKTGSSSIIADLNLQFSSLQALKDSIGFVNLNLEMENISIANGDILYFSPDLQNQPFFENASMITSVSGIVTGGVNNLKGTNVVIKTGSRTILKSDFTIVGLPDVKNANFNFPDLKVNSTSQDIEMMAGPSIPKNISLPRDISLDVIFKGRMKAFDSNIKMKSTFGDVQLVANIDQNENFKSKINIDAFNLGSLLKDTAMFGPLSLTAEANGHGLDKITLTANVAGQVSDMYLNRYTFQNLKLDGNIKGEEFQGKVNLDDKNAAIDFDGLVNLNPDHEQYKFTLNIKGADLQKLNITKDDIRIGLVVQADLKGGTINKMNGKAGITNMIIAQGDKKYVLDSLLFASINETNKSEINFNSALIGVKYSGTLSPIDLSGVLTGFLGQYFPVSDSIRQKKAEEPTNFNFEIQLHNHPIISQLLFPQLKEFEPGVIHGSFDSKKNSLSIDASITKIVYGATEINDLNLNVNSNSKTLNYKLSSSSILNSSVKLNNFLFDGNLADNTLYANISSVDKRNKKIVLRSKIIKDKGNYKLSLDPGDFYLMNSRWNVADDNFIEFGKDGFRIHHFFLNNSVSQINVASVNDRFNDDLNIAIKNFKLDDISRIVEKDTSILKGTVDGNVLLKKVRDTYGIISDAQINNLFVKNTPVGNITIKADNPTAEKFDINLKLSGEENEMTTDGSYVPDGGDHSLNFKTAIKSLSMKTIAAFSMGQITDGSGNLSGDFTIAGAASAPEITGELVFNDAFIKPTILNNKLELNHQTIRFEKDGIYLNAFTLLDPNKNSAIFDGAIHMKNFNNISYALNVKTRDFLLFNSTDQENKNFYGRMIIDSRLDINGPMELPVINGRLKMKKGSNFTFAVPESKLTPDKGEEVVEFENSRVLNPILTRSDNKSTQKSKFSGFDLTSVVEVDKEATLRLLMDPASSDSLVVRGDAALSFAMDRTGKMNLTGAYNLDEGSYLVSLQSVIKRKFDIVSGSKIIWNSDPLDAEISIDATYSVTTAPYDLVADQVSGLSDTEKGGYKQRYPFLVLLKLRGEILHPVISFEIQLHPQDKGILGGAVNQKLTLLNDDVSALNKQVFALLVLGRFIQENPLQTESGGGTSALIRSTVSNFLSSELNKLSSKVIPGAELNFNVQSYDDYESGQAKGRTQVEIGIKKQLFNDRMSVQVGGNVDVEGDRAKQNSASDITSDVTIEYKLSKDGRFRMKGFRHNQYQDPIEGQFVETGAGLLYSREFNKWKDFFKSPKRKKRDELEKENNDETVKNK